MASSLYVKLDASYDEDAKILEAGEKAELLYIRALCLSKRILSDGFIADAQLPRLGLNQHLSRARKLVDVGLWRRDDERRGYWIVAWTKWNRTAADVEAQRAQARADGVRGNHRRWHRDQPSADCPICIEQGRVEGALTDHPPDSATPSPTGSGSGSGDPIGYGSPEAEPKAEAEITPPGLDLETRANGNGTPTKTGGGDQLWPKVVDHLAARNGTVRRALAEARPAELGKLAKAVDRAAAAGARPRQLRDLADRPGPLDSPDVKSPVATLASRIHRHLDQEASA